MQGGPPGPIARIGAMLHLTMHDVINAAAGTYSSYLTSVPDPDAGVNVEDAASYAAYAVLSHEYPTQRALFKAELRKYGGKKPSDTNAHKAFGEEVAAQMLALRADDNLDNNMFMVMDAPGQWTPTGSGDAATPNWGKLKPFGGFEMTIFRTGLPSNYDTIAELLGSEEYAAQYNEVLRLGSANSAERTPEQTEIALFWANDLDDTSKPPGQLYTLTQIVARKRRLTVAQNAHLFALVALAMADAAIVA
ncbi:hypothetical protein [Hymenobacter roseosalivarius]|uniref:hypothetical protein n=1 Tax=Hymenobacter roseosalivarius TaxID=89967 RepID=UPI001F439882|nr:hypothetical protein [Hymenobacter roseosalivarius]